MKFRILLAAAALTAHGCDGSPGTAAAQHRHRRHGRRLLPAGRRFRQHPRQGVSGHDGHRAGDRRVGRQPAAGRLGQGRHGLLAGRRGLGRRQRQGQVPRQAADPRPGGHVRQPHARRDGRRHRHQQDRGPEGQARVDGFARQRHRGVCQSRAGSRRHRSREGHQEGAPRRCRERQCHQGQEDRCLHVGRRAADCGRDRSGFDTQHQDQAARFRASHRRR